MSRRAERARASRRLAAYVWAAPNTALGLLGVLVALASGGRARRRGGVIEACGGALPFLLRRLVPLAGGAAALTLGHIVLARSAATLEATRAHERVHVRQYERWGVLFLPAYVACGAWALLHGHGPYRGNRFEREACAAADAPLDPGGLSPRAALSPPREAPPASGW